MIFLFLLALILFGPKRLPEIAREVGKFVAEFKRASNDFKYQLQNEIENAGKETPAKPAEAAPSLQPAAQQTNSFTQTLLPPAVKSAISNIDNAHDRLMKTARMAFEAQNFTLRPPGTVAVSEEPAAGTESAAPAATAAESSTGATNSEPAPTDAETKEKAEISESAPGMSNSAAQQNS